MSYKQNELDRIVELYNTIENGKSQEYAAPTYKDSPCLKEMSEIVLRHTETDAETLKESVTVLCYLADCYDAMCRAGMSVKYYTPLLSAYAELAKQNELEDKEKEDFEGCFYAAVKARNYYEPDNCDDLAAIVKDCLTEQKIKELVSSAQENRRSFIKCDPIEKTEKYLAVIDMVEKKIDENKTMDFCLEYWRLKADYLSEHGIRWSSPARLNPRVMFD